MEIIDADKFVLEQVYRPYQSLLGFEKTLLKQPYSNEQTLKLLQSDSEWARLTLDRIKRCKFKFSQWINHPVINYIKETVYG